ncbi:MAG TPA: choice-of-anchor tandem repeat GloVer-containing protein [Verrucomicrobiae bacterium]|nr:choice-of-anchor tandem repeat GloVer-containing protein [Verrucomicrobiae bacterium]
MKTPRNLIALASATSLLAATANTHAQYTLLHSFAGSPTDGRDPHGSLTQVGTTLYGMTPYGGSNYGMIFQINTDGSGYTNLYSFAGYPIDGSVPNGSLTLNGTNLYGITEWGGSQNAGTIFQIGTDGSGYAKLYWFGSVANDGYQPLGSLTLNGTNLYGMALDGGTSFNYGMLFHINTDGSGYTNLHSFAGPPNDGANPVGDLTLVGSTLYGMTSGGGSQNTGTVFRINTDGSGYTNLHSFGSVANDGNQPFGSFTLNGTTLYGMTSGGGSSGSGTVFRINTDGSGYTNLHSFGSVANDGSQPCRSLMLAGSILYGMTFSGGSQNSGTVFLINTDGSGCTNLHSFGSVPDDGANPVGGVTLVGSTLYGTAYRGGVSNLGAIFSLTLPAPPGPLTVNKLWARVNLNPAKADMDTCSLAAMPALGPAFSVTNQTVTVNIGDAETTFALNAKGTSKSATNSCKLAYAKKTGVWTLTASMKKGSWAIPWAKYGVTNASTPKAGVTIEMPVSVLIGTNSFATDQPALYKATAGKSGTLK